MKPPAFEYLDPTSIEEALARLAEFGDEAKILAGGQSLVPLLNFRLARPAVLIDINNLADLAGIEPVDGGLRIGALTRHAAVERSALVRAGWPVLAEAAPLIGHRQIRNRGTFGGSLAHADPAAEWPLLVRLLDGRMRIRRAGGNGAIEYPAAEFFTGYLSTVLGPDELLAEVILPPLPDGVGWAFQEVSQRHGDFALVAAGAIVGWAADGTVASLRLAIGGVGPAPVRAAEAEAAAVGRHLDEDLLREVAARVQAAIDPEPDLHASADYRREVAGTLARRVLLAAAERARGRGG